MSRLIECGGCCPLPHSRSTEISTKPSPTHLSKERKHWHLDREMETFRQRNFGLNLEPLGSVHQCSGRRALMLHPLTALNNFLFEVRECQRSTVGWLSCCSLQPSALLTLVGIEERFSLQIIAEGWQCSGQSTVAHSLGFFPSYAPWMFQFVLSWCQCFIFLGGFVSFSLPYQDQPFRIVK